MGCLGAIVMAVIALLIWAIYEIVKSSCHAAAVAEFERRVNTARTTLVGSKVETKLVLLNTVSSLLEPMYSVGGIEGAICLYLDSGKQVLDVQHWVGGSCSVPMPPASILSRAHDLGAHSVAVAHNHPNAYVTPSDQDVWHAAGLLSTLESEGITLVESYVWCGNQFKSVLNTRRYKDLIKPTF